MSRSTVSPQNPPTTPPQASKTKHPFNLCAYLFEHIDTHASKTALLHLSPQGTQSWTYQQIYSAVRQLHIQLCATQLPKGARILIRLGNQPLFAFGFLAAISAGYRPIPVSPQLTEEEVAYLWEDSEASLALVDPKLPFPSGLSSFSLSPSVEQSDSTEKQDIDFFYTDPDSPAYMIYTSGTTGWPKGVLHAHRSILGRIPMFGGWTDLKAQDILLHAGQLNWTYTLGLAVFDAWQVGATSVIVEGPNDPARWASLIQEHQISIFAAVPSVYRQILKYTPEAGPALRSLRHGLTAGEALSPSLAERWEETMGCPLYEALGMSECSTYISCGPSVPRKAGSPGRPQQGRRIAILPMDTEEDPLPTGETGLLAIHRSDPGLMLGYWKRPDEEALIWRGEWFVGGDLAHLDQDGYIWFHGRQDDLLNAQGYRVSPREIERALERHPAIQEAAVCEVSPREGLSLLAAVLVPSPSFAETPHARIIQEAQGWSAQHLARYKQPRLYIVAPILPRTKNGKLNRNKLSDFF
ncbi:MAG: acyl-CoA synthetase [Myxococcales bacterium]|nr:acyl-CoA synthetase [Myxococcales bacterium]